MSSIVIFIIFVVISMVFQAMKQENNKGKRPEATHRPVGPMTPPTVAAHRSPEGQNPRVMQSNRVQVKAETKAKMMLDDLNVLNSEGMQTEGPTSSVSAQPIKIQAEPEKELGHLDIDMDNLQRSIIMSEILGKPKALRKN
jgi:uncharacterized iron-regulated membrane protein